MTDLKRRLSKAVQAAFVAVGLPAELGRVTASDRPDLADFQCNGALPAAKVAKLGVVIYEVGISYYGRTSAEGKKIGWRDGIRALYAIGKYNIFR